jgi:hypothetical protein
MAPLLGLPPLPPPCKEFVVEDVSADVAEEEEEVEEAAAGGI